MAGESALKWWEGVKLVTAVEQCVSGTKDLRFIGKEFHKWEMRISYPNPE